MALDFDGASQYIQVAQNSGLPIYDDTTYSICGWVKAPAQDDKRIFSEGSSANNYPLLTIGSGGTSDEADDKIHMYIRNDARVANLHAFSTTTVFDNTWHHFCWVDNNGTTTLYIDGVKDATNFNYTRSGTFTLNRTGIAAIIRAEVSYWLNGELFDIRCYNRRLTANEIAEIYHKRGADRVWQGLVGWWRLDELIPAPLLIDPLDSSAGWTVTNGLFTENTTTYKEGGKALNVIKTTTAVTGWRAGKSINSVNLTNQTIKWWVYVKDTTTLNKITNVRLFLGNDWGDNLRAVWTGLSVGWNDLSKHIDGFTVASGTPDKSAITFIMPYLTTAKATDTTAAGDLIYDFVRTGDYPSSIYDLSGNGNHGTPYNSPVYQTSPHRLRRGVLVS